MARFCYCVNAQLVCEEEEEEEEEEQLLVS
jgi:hypothetical protein